MSLWNKIATVFRRKPETPTSFDNSEAVAGDGSSTLSFAFWTSYSWAQSRLLLREHPEIQGPVTRYVYQRMISEMRAEGRHKIAAALQVHLNVLNAPSLHQSLEAIEKRVEEWGDLKLDYGASEERVKSAVSRLMNEVPRDEKELEKLIQSQPELMSEDADEALLAMVREVGKSAASGEMLVKEPVLFAQGLLFYRELLAKHRYLYGSEIGHRAYAAGNWELAVLAYEMACQASEVLVAFASTNASKQSRIEMDGSLFQKMAVSLIERGESQLAALALERGKARLMTEIAHRDDVETEKLTEASELIDEYRQARSEYVQLQKRQRGLEFPDTLYQNPGGLKEYARALSSVPAEKSALYNQLHSEISILIKDPSYATQLLYVLPLITAGKPYKESPFYDAARCEKLVQLFDAMGQSLGAPQGRSLDSIVQDAASPIAPELIQNEVAKFLEETKKVTMRLLSTEQLLGLQMPNPQSEIFASALDTLQLATKKLPAMVYLFTSDRGATALIVKPGGTGGVAISVVQSPVLSTQKLREQLFGNGESEDKTSWFGAYTRRYVKAAAWRKAIDKTLTNVWNLFLRDVYEVLAKGDCDRIVLIPSGLLAVLPLHAASWYGCDRGSADLPIVSYTPSVRLLTRALKRARESKPDDLLAVVDPCPSTQVPLAFACEEVEIISARFYQPWGNSIMGPSILRGENASRYAIRPSLSGEYWRVVHFACHAATDWKDNEESGVFLAGDEKLRIKELFYLERSTGRLAFVAGCETGVSPRDMTDESMVLPTGLLRAGFAGAVTSLWAVEDMSTALIAIRFYQEWLDNGSEPAVALHRAQEWVRGTSNQEKYDDLSRILTEVNSSENLPAKVRERTCSSVSRLQAALISDPDARPFGHPYYWAAFYITGA